MVHRKPLLLVIPVLLSTVAFACSGQGGREGIELVNGSSKLIGTLKIDPLQPTVQLPETFSNLNIAPLSTYRLNGKGDVPYVEMGQLSQALDISLGSLVNHGMTHEVKEDGFHLYSANRKGELILDAKLDTVKTKGVSYFTAPITFENNGIPGDYCSFRGTVIKDSPKTRRYKDDGGAVSEYQTYSFGDYGFDIYEKDAKYYVPFEAVTKIMYQDVGVDFAFNGSEYYLTALGSFTSSLINSSKGYWSAYSGIYAPSPNKGPGEAYRFHFSYTRMKNDDSGESETVTKFLVLNDDESKRGYCILCPGTEFDPNNTLPDVESNYSYTWRKEGEILYIAVSGDAGILGEYGIHLDETRFIKGTISREVSDYNYNILRLMFDKIYGLKAIKGYASADAYFDSLGVKSGLKSTEAATYNAALAKLMGSVDDGHSGFTRLPIYTPYDDLDSLSRLNKENLGPRVGALGQKKTAYAKARIDKYAELHPGEGGNVDPNFYHGIQFSSDKKTAVITFDSFTHEQATLKNMKELFPTDDEIDQIIVRSRMIFSSADGFSAAFRMLQQMNKASKTVENVVIDLTNNGGGMIAIVPYLTAFFSDDPTYVLRDTLDGSVYEYHYQVDLNGDGVYGGPGDTFKNDFNFYILTSGFSFSCGNALPGIAKDNGIKVIGEQSGGGTSPVGVFFDALGSGIQLSNHTNMSYKGADGKYVQNDAGIPLDYGFPLDKGNWYDPNQIDAFLKTIRN